MNIISDLKQQPKKITKWSIVVFLVCLPFVVCFFLRGFISLSLSLVHTYAPPFDICMKISPICPTFVCVVFTPPSHQMIWPNPFFFCLFTSLPYCNRHLYNHLLLLHTSYIYSRCTICLVKNNNNNNKKIRIEKLTKRFQKNARANKSFFCFFLVFVLLYSVSIFVVECPQTKHTHTQTERTVSFDCMYVIRVCVCVCVVSRNICVSPRVSHLFRSSWDKKR